MKNLFLVLLVSLFAGVSVNAQMSPTPTPTAATEAKPKKQIFRANKNQILTVQKQLKVEETGKMDDATRAAINARYTIS